MSVAFPAVCPTRRSFTPGEYQTKRYSSISGASVTRLYGSRAANAQMSLDFVLGDADTAAVLQSWHDSKGGAYTLNLPSSVFDGASSDLNGKIPSYLNWRWAEMPSVESLVPGRSRVQAKLTATLDA